MSEDGFGAFIAIDAEDPRLCTRIERCLFGFDESLPLNLVDGGAVGTEQVERAIGRAAVEGDNLGTERGEALECEADGGGRVFADQRDGKREFGGAVRDGWGWGHAG